MIKFGIKNSLQMKQVTFPSLRVIPTKQSHIEACLCSWSAPSNLNLFPLQKLIWRTQSYQ